MSRIEFFFDVSSPWTYMAAQQVVSMARDMGAELVWRPFLVGSVFNKVNPSVYGRRENPIECKERYYRKDMHDWATYLGLTLIRPSVFPVNSVKALRGAFHAIDTGNIERYAFACFEAYWRDDRDISSDEVLADVARTAGLEWQGAQLSL